GFTASQLGSQLEKTIEPSDTAGRVGQPLRCEVHVRAVMRSNQFVAQHSGVHRAPRDFAFEHVADRVEIAGAFRHLLAFDEEETYVQPVTSKMALARRSARLRDLALVVREN